MPEERNYKLKWDETSKRYFESGNKQGVLYQINSDGEYVSGEVWNGLTAVSSNAGGAEANELWADDMKYAVLRSAETYGGTIECYTYPDSFKQNNGEANFVPGPNGKGVPGIVASGQSRKAFGFSFRTSIGNDVDGLDHGYKLHLVYNATASPSEKGYQTINDSPDAITMSYEFETTPIRINDSMKPTAHIEIDSTQLSDAHGQAFLAALEQILYGTPETSVGAGDAIDARMPLPAELITLYNSVNF